jgi:hypothetical protein
VGWKGEERGWAGVEEGAWLEVALGGEDLVWTVMGVVAEVLGGFSKPDFGDRLDRSCYPSASG